MLRLATLLALLMAALGVLAQGYAPRPGETVMRVSVAERGDVFILLHTKQAPNTTSRVIDLVQQGFYDGQRFFRVVKSPRPFLVQTGDPASRTRPMDDPTLGQGGSGQSLKYEDSGFPNEAGAVGLSTLPNDRDSGDSQFYILLGPARFLDGNYTVFGRVVQGMDVVNAIELGDQVTSVTILRG